MIQRCVHIHVNLELIVWVALAMTELYKAISCMRKHAQRDFTVSWVPVLPWGMDYARVDLLALLEQQFLFRHHLGHLLRCLELWSLRLVFLVTMPQLSKQYNVTLVHPVRNAKMI